METCVCAGSVDCPSWVEWLKVSYTTGKDAPKITKICDAYEPIPAEWLDDGDPIIAAAEARAAVVTAAEREIDDAVNLAAEERKASIERAYQEYYEGYL
jgi:hypothetical protein